MKIATLSVLVIWLFQKKYMVQDKKENGNLIYRVVLKIGSLIYRVGELREK